MVLADTSRKLHFEAPRIQLHCAGNRELLFEPDHSRHKLATGVKVSSGKYSRQTGIGELRRMGFRLQQGRGKIVLVHI
jgi:hypothetical protein